MYISRLNILSSCLPTGTGASCIYPLLGIRLNGWKFLATDVDEKAVGYAQANVSRNGLDDKIEGTQYLDSISAVSPLKL